MDPPFSGFVLDPSKCRNLSIKEKRDLIRELSKWPQTAPEKLHTWSRRDILEILCAEIGKERKYSSIKKEKLIEHLFRVVSEKRSGERTEEIDPNPHLHMAPINPQAPSKRQRKADNPSRLPVVTSNLPVNENGGTQSNTRYCRNLACGATLSQEDAFCKRCSCCICLNYDDNKDPSLWLVCSSETSYEADPCGLSCHLECALKDERAGISENGQCTRLDGSYYCIYCGKVNDLLRCWRKQLMVAKDARRVDVLCYRISLSHKLLRATEKYQCLHQIVDTVVKKLESEVGPLNGLPNMARGIVNRLSVGAEVQRLCASAIDANAQMHKSSLILSDFIKFEDASPTFVTVVLSSEDQCQFAQEVVGYTLWHRRADTSDYPVEPTCKVFTAKARFPVRGLVPSTEYMFKIIAFGNTRELAKWEIGLRTESMLNDVPNPSAEILDSEEPSDPVHSGSALDEEEDPDSVVLTDSTKSETMIVPPKSAEPATPCKLEEAKEDSGRFRKEGSGKVEKPLGGSGGSSEGDFERCIKVMRWLECEGHIETDFRVKLMTWFSLRANGQERRVVSAYIDALIDDPTSLAGQLVDTFSEAVSRKRPPPVPAGFCTRLWH